METRDPQIGLGKRGIALEKITVCQPIKFCDSCRRFTHYVETVNGYDYYLCKCTRTAYSSITPAKNILNRIIVACDKYAYMWTDAFDASLDDNATMEEHLEFRRINNIFQCLKMRRTYWQDVVYGADYEPEY